MYIVYLVYKIHCFTACNLRILSFYHLTFKIVFFKVIFFCRVFPLIQGYALVNIPAFYFHTYNPE